MKRILSLSTIAVLLVGGVGLGNEKKPASFGALEIMSAAQAQTHLAVWLKEVGKYDEAKLKAIWSDENRSILDRVGDSLALGNADAAKLMAEARDPNAPAPTIVHAVFKDESTSQFFRANLALAYARSLANRRVYEESLDTLKLFTADQVCDPAAYLFHRAVCEHALQRRTESTKSITRLLEEGNAIAPERYKTVATLMLLDMHTWKDKDLGNIARMMDNVERRLGHGRGGPETQRQEREILNRLDEMIKKLENQNKNKKKKPGEGEPKDGDGDNDGECPGCDKPGQGSGKGPPKNNQQPSNPATQEGDGPGPGDGKADPKKFEKLVSDWGGLTPGQRSERLQTLTKTLPPRQREAIEAYFKSLTNPNLKSASK